MEVNYKDEALRSVSKEYVNELDEYMTENSVEPS